MNVACLHSCSWEAGSCAQQTCGCAAAQAVHIGDSLKADIQGGINAGLAATVWVCPPSATQYTKHKGFRAMVATLILPMYGQACVLLLSPGDRLHDGLGF